ncbi:uncharacterized protein TRAVEDRAFT_71578 [Trametes versicolor FP-101664 SS1]|uniref:uncharacterized protein n=1 Tax=Trametes versicolor (strain FP-101664) TaxID=717944 RepID=UPI0004621AB8|nr:uncharacterized protein TRAVEDRAFT_71578 [Trametes versicolor FP-101664 SS1]EIW59545.1 hypothetical protein TRAVEDRAFT_71578 [Trametes versicolor FP-101664 SS1]
MNTTAPPILHPQSGQPLTAGQASCWMQRVMYECTHTVAALRTFTLPVSIREEAIKRVRTLSAHADMLEQVLCRMCFFLPEASARTVAAIIAAAHRQQALLVPPTRGPVYTRCQPRFILNDRALASLTAYLIRVEGIIFTDVRWRQSPEGRQLLQEAADLRLRMHASRTEFAEDMLEDPSAAELPDLDRPAGRGPEWAPLSEFLSGLGGLWGSRGIRPGWGGWLPPDYAVASTGGWAEMLLLGAAGGGPSGEEEDDAPSEEEDDAPSEEEDNAPSEEEDDAPSPATTAYSPPLQFVSLRQIEKAREFPTDVSSSSASADDDDNGILLDDPFELSSTSSPRAPSWPPPDPNASSSSSSTSAFASSSSSISSPSLGSSSSSHMPELSSHHSPLSSRSGSPLPIDASLFLPPATPMRSPGSNFDSPWSPPPAPRKRRRSAAVHEDDDDAEDTEDPDDASLPQRKRVRRGGPKERKRQRIYVRFSAHSAANPLESGQAAYPSQPSDLLASPFAHMARAPQEDAGRRDSTASWASSAHTLSGEHADDMDTDVDADSFVTANDGACDEWVVYDPENAPDEPIRDPSPPRSPPRMSSRAAGKRRCWDVLHTVQRFFAIR